MCEIGKVDSKADGCGGCCAKSAFVNQKDLMTRIARTFAQCTFWNLRCPKFARGCGANHICQWKDEKNDGYKQLFWRFNENNRLLYIYKLKYSKHRILGPLFWKSYVQNIGSRYGAKHNCKSKWAKYVCFNFFFDIELNC